MTIDSLKAMDPTARLKTLRELYRNKDPLFDAYMEMAAGEVIEHYADTQRHLENIYQDNCEGAFVQTSELDRTRQALSEVDPTNPALGAVPPSFGVWEQQRHRITALEADLTALRAACEVMAKEVVQWRTHTEENYYTNALRAAAKTDADPIAAKFIKEHA